ncbi:transcriptional regulator, CdaR family [Nocardioides szechwanensis]|uniref:Transcriptional regulator, CdaR family n=1 Tax=Nocardioides szechwanensis TaxID=1005944 RepID=A0A1H0JJ11_9ACTN|nr:GAF domain-containing protein [Nocardioides szechwanensis]SDO43768.1 transcriptional regulator, CdaR family [Nocardioides szechwanensis]
MSSQPSAPAADAEASRGYHLRRERELASLYATARSLTALGELDDVLQSIVRHAHELIGTDFTYLSLLGPNGELRVGACEGTISADFRAAGVPPNSGLGGQVIGQKTPVWVRNYLEAHELAHDADFDLLVVREGMVALLGVPLLVRDKAIGALFAADRSERDFDSEEIALFSAFANHAAVALDNARLYNESRSALHDLQSAYQVIEEHVATMERAQSVHEALTHLVLTGGGPEQVAGQLVEQLGGAVTVLGRDDLPIAYAGADSPFPDDADGERTAPSTIAAALVSARGTGRSATATDDSGTTHSVAAVQAGETYLGALVWTRPSAPAPADQRMLERASHIVGLMTLKENAIADAAERLSGELLTELLVSSPAVSRTQRSRTRARGIDVDSLNLLVVAESATVPTSALTRTLHAYASRHAGLAGEYLGRATMIVHVDDPHAAVTDAHQVVRRQLGRPVTIIGERVQGTDWARAFPTASRCCALAAALGHSDSGAMTSQFAPFSLLFDSDRVGDLEHFLDSSIGPLLAYDAHRSTELARTATAYFANQGNVAQTARALHVHLNTLMKRLDRITALLGEAWRTSDSLRINLACRLHELASGSPAHVE